MRRTSGMRAATSGEPLPCCVPPAGSAAGMRQTLPLTRASVRSQAAEMGQLPPAVAPSFGDEPLAQEFGPEPLTDAPAFRRPLAQQPGQRRIGPPARAEFEHLGRLEEERHPPHVLQQVPPTTARLHARDGTPWTRLRRGA